MRHRIFVVLVFQSACSMLDQSLSSLLQWLDSCPTPFHVVDHASQLLKRSSFLPTETLAGELPAAGFMTIDGGLIAWRLGSAKSDLRIIGAHTDSPNLRVLSQPDIVQQGWAQLAIEIYGGVLLNSWLDRDLGIAGRVISSDGQSVLFNVAAPLARVPQLAIHLDRDVNDRGVVLDKHQHLSPVWGLGSHHFAQWLTEVSGVSSIAAFDAHLFDITPAAILGVDNSLLASARLDNQLSCWAAINALISTEQAEHTTVVVLNDHEEVGSESTTGAAGPLLASVISRINDQHGVLGGARFDRMSRSWCLSADNAHAVHPNYTERHEPRHAPVPNAGPALKLNGNQRYATSAIGAAHIRSVAAEAHVPLQTFMSRNNMPCGSTIGPITATQLGINAIDVGVPQLSMHSARELCGSQDPGHLLNLMKAFISH
jgi:aspartyl aminopeptidase